MNDVDQQENIVHGDQAGRDVIKNIGHAETGTTIQRLMEEHRQAIEDNEIYKETIDELTYFVEELVEGESRSLSEKLSDGGFSERVLRAKKLKEMFAKKLNENALSEPAQKIYARLLGLAYMNFRRYVRPAIDDSSDKSEVDKIIAAEVVEPLLEELEGATLIATPQEILGMLYFLTGNCHVRWD